MSDAPTAAEDRRADILAEGMNRLWEWEGDGVRPDEAARFIELLDRHDEQEGVVRVNLARQRAIDADLSRVRAALHAALTAMENGITPPPSMVEGWRLAEAGR